MTIRLIGYLRRNTLMEGHEINQFGSTDSLNELWKNTFDQKKDFPIPIDFTKHHVVMISKNLRLHEQLGIVNISEAASISFGIYCLGEQKESRSAFHLLLLVPQDQRIGNALLTKSKKLLETTKTVKKLNKDLENLHSKGYQRMDTASLEAKIKELSSQIDHSVITVSGLDLRNYSLTLDNPLPLDG